MARERLFGQGFDKQLDADEVSGTHIACTSSNGVKQSREVTIISEPGLYHAIINRKPQKAKGDDGEAAKKIEMAVAFRKWVTDVVLVSIRKHGGYIQGQELLDGPEKAELIAEIEKLHARYAKVSAKWHKAVAERNEAKVKLKASRKSRKAYKKDADENYNKVMDLTYENADLWKEVLWRRDAMSGKTKPAPVDERREG